MNSLSLGFLGGLKFLKFVKRIFDMQGKNLKAGIVNFVDTATLMKCGKLLKEV